MKLSMTCMQETASAVWLIWIRLDHTRALKHLRSYKRWGSMTGERYSEVHCLLAMAVLTNVLAVERTRRVCRPLSYAVQGPQK